MKKKYPLVVCLPYDGYKAEGAEDLTNYLNRSPYPAFILVPYCGKGTSWGGLPGYLARDQIVYELITKLADSGIDKNRRYVTGVSKGGFGTWQFICTRPDLFAAAIPVCGGADPRLAYRLVKMPIWAFHGAKDTHVPVNGSRDMIAAIKKLGGHPAYTEYPDGTHNIWSDASQTSNLWEWLFAQRKNQ